ncbi:MAG: hypothetical protein AABN95_11675 [Acidobacteriota bacterium]
MITGPILKTAVLIVMWLVLSAVDAQACTCMGQGAPCQAYGATAAVFVGTPIGVTHTKSEPGADGRSYTWAQRVFTFSVAESFRGVEGAKEVQVRTGQGGGDCGYNFRIGDAYLVYAYRDQSGQLYASICSRTRLVSSASEDLEYIRGIAKRAPGASLSGSVQQMRRNLETEETQKLGPLTDIEIVVEGEGLTLQVRTDKQGRYSLSNLPAGRYKVRPVPPAKLNTYEMAQSVVLHDRGCAAADFYIYDNGRISGQATDSEGQPVPRIMVDLIPVSQASSERPRSMFVSADDEGRFELKFVPPGSYLLGIRLDGLGSPGDPETPFPRTYYPGVAAADSAAVIVLGEGEVVSGAVLKLLPKLRSRTITGTVVLPDGRPAALAQISYRDTAYTSPYSYHGIGADEQGRFTIQAVEGLSYMIKAYINADGGQRHAEPIEVPAHGEPKEIRLVIVHRDGSCARCRDLMKKREPAKIP